ncbi:LOW QUALITY PROTEIN: Peptidase_M20 domain-containing protein, partial [Cephalotus follicularis]
DWIVGITRKIHENPELGYEEFKTSELIRAELHKMGVIYTYPVVVTGVVNIRTGKPPFAALKSRYGCSCYSGNGGEHEHNSKFHGKIYACCHDAYVTMLIGALKILQEHREELKGTVVLVFQAAEKGGGGTAIMASAEALENVSAIFGLHVDTSTQIGVASISDPLLARGGIFEAVISGKRGRAA